MKRTGFKRKAYVWKKTKIGFKGKDGKKYSFKAKKLVKKRKIKSPLKILKDELWELCKQLTRKVYGYHCYTCGDYVDFPHTGHFITDSTCSTELSYDLKNLRPQCYSCNIWKSGNWVAFEARLIRDEGKSYIEELKERNRKTMGLRYDILWFKTKVKEYRELLESLNKTQ